MEKNHKPDTHLIPMHIPYQQRWYDIGRYTGIQPVTETAYSEYCIHHITHRYLSENILQTISG